MQLSDGLSKQFTFFLAVICPRWTTGTLTKLHLSHFLALPGIWGCSTGCFLVFVDDAGLNTELTSSLQQPIAAGP